MAILVIDDEQFIQSLAQKILNRDGHEVLLASSGKEAISIFESRENDIRLILLDYHLKDMNGAKVLITLRHIVPDLICIISSGVTLSRTELPEDLTPNTHFLQKPYRADRLSDLVAQLLQ